MKKQILAALALTMVVGSTVWAARAIRVTVKLPNAMTILVDGYQSSTGEILPPSGNRDMTILDAKGNKVESKLALNSGEIMVVDAANSSSAYFVSFGDGLKEVGGVDGLAKIVTDELKLKAAIKITSVDAKTDDFAIIKVDIKESAKGTPVVDVDYAQSAKMSVGAR
jgi:hypothetical protein